MKRGIQRGVLLLTACLLFLASCGSAEWKGFEKEDLTKYLALGPYKGLAYTSYDIAVSDREVEEAIALRLEAATPLTKTEEPIAEGTTVTFDRFCFLDGVSTPALSEEGGTYRCGTAYEDTVIASLLSQMIGMKLGDTAELTVTLPEGYTAVGSPACKAVYRVTVRALYVKNLPELTDAVASTLMTGVKTAEELRSAIRTKLEAEKKEEAAYRTEAELWNRLLEGSEMISLPEDLYRSYYSDLCLNYENLSAAVSTDLESYLSSSLGITLAELEARLSSQAEAQVKEALVLHSVAKAEGLSSADEEVKAFAEARAKEGDIFESGEEYLDFYGIDAVAEQLLKEKILSLMVEEGVAAS